MKLRRRVQSSSTNVRASFFRVQYDRTMSALRLIVNANSFATFYVAPRYPIRRKMGARSQRRCLPGLISNPEVKPYCVNPNTVVRKSTEKDVTVPLFFHSEVDPQTSTSVGRLAASPFWSCGLFCVIFIFILRYINLLIHFSATIRASSSSMLIQCGQWRGLIAVPIVTANMFGSDDVGIHLAIICTVLVPPPELPKPVLELI